MAHIAPGLRLEPGYLRVSASVANTKVFAGELAFRLDVLPSVQISCLVFQFQREVDCWLVCSASAAEGGGASQ